MTPDPASICRQHLGFMKWADDLMLAAVAERTPSQISILQHIYLAEATWLGRIEGRRDLLISHLEAPPDIGALQRAWPELHRKWLHWAESLEDWNTLVPHVNAAGTEFNMPAWQIVFHVVNHGSFHRGQVAAMLRASGFAPPVTDLIVYYRSRHDSRD